MIKIPKIQIFYPYKRVINSFNVNSKGIYKVVGKSGSGKTTYLNELIKYLIGSKIENIIFIKQSHQLPPHSTINEIFSGYKFSKVKNFLKLLDIHKNFDSDSNELSGGEVQRVLLAEAILYNPALIIMDEPVSAIDKKGILAVKEALLSYVDGGGSLIYVSHVELTKDFIKIDIT